MSFVDRVGVEERAEYARPAFDEDVREASATEIAEELFDSPLPWGEGNQLRPIRLPPR